jgi:hypothetical protein
MRSIILTAVLALGTLGILGGLPTETKAFPPGFVNTNTVGPNSMTTRMSSPYFSYYSRPYSGAGMTYASPAMMGMYSNPSGFGAVYATPGVVSYNMSAVYGLGYYYSTPGYAGYSYSPYTGYNTFYVPRTTVAATPLGGFYSSYLPASYIAP